MDKLPITGDPSIDELPYEERRRTIYAIGIAAHADDHWLEANPRRNTFLRLPLPYEVPGFNPQDGVVIIVRRDRPGDPIRRFIRVAGMPLTDEALRGEQIAAALFKLCDENLGRSFFGDAIANRLKSKLSSDGAAGQSDPSDEQQLSGGK